ncbi:MAG: IS1182 family transposase [Rhodoferax sp.]|nr:IS1182 family transposase [Rhodoferax sp.]
MPRCKPVDRSPRLLPVVLSEQIQSGTFEFALDHLVDHELNLDALDVRFNNDEVGASAYDPRVMLKIVLLAYSRGLISSRRIEHACLHHVQFIAISGDSQPSYTHIAKFVRELGPQIKALFTEVLLTCDRMGLIGRQMFAIDGVKLPANASKERSGTHAELRHRAARLDQAAAKIIALHQSQDDAGQDHELSTKHQDRIEALRKEAQVTRDFVAGNKPRLNRKGQELKTNITDPDSAKMATSKGVIQGYAAQAAVDSAHQVIVAAEVTGSGSEQAMLLPMVQASSTVREAHTLITADAGYHSKDNIAALREANIPALIADNQMRQRDERLAEQAKHKAKPDPLYDKGARAKEAPIRLYRPVDFTYHAPTNSCICPAGQHLYSNGNHCMVRGKVHHRFTGAKQSCVPCQRRDQCLRKPQSTQVRHVSIFAKNQPSPHAAIELMKQAIDSARGRHLYSQRIGTVEPVFGNIRHNKRLNRFTLRGKAKVNAQWSLYCLVHNIEKLANHGYAQ